MNNRAIPTGKVFNLGCFNILEVECEPCIRFLQIAKGLPITCACTACRERVKVEDRVAESRAWHDSNFPNHEED